MVKIAPSILAANFMCLEKELLDIEFAGADLIHFDVMDGHFVPNITFGPMILHQAKKKCGLAFDVHLMVNDPIKFIPWYAEAKPDIITFHLEATLNPEKEIELIKSFGIKVGISIKPETDVEVLDNFIDVVDLILIMSVNPGFGGQKFNHSAIDKIKYLKEKTKNTKTLIEVDGGINMETAKLCIDAGADILVAGSAIFGSNNYADSIRQIKGE
ncbi:MAG: ribulose-phosphate 3-epimerase [Alphaproteobacteria bacterium]|nr:ribulose-phosphate 3-epimerase [Alphaproteobacteria bacterium]